MLLFVMQTEFEEGHSIAVTVEAPSREVIANCIVDVGPVGHHIGDAGSRQHSSLWPGMHGPDRLIVGIEQRRGCRVKGLVPAAAFLHELREHECLEVPRRMGEMPFCRAGRIHRLNALVLG